jgi:serine protease AprX
MDAHENMAHVLEHVEGLGGAKPRQLSQNCVEVTVDREHLDYIAESEHVQAIAEAYEISAQNDLAQKVIGFNSVGSWHAKPPGLTGAGQVVAVADSGVDANHAAIQGSIVGSYSLESAPSADMLDHNGHGTHVAGTVLGRPQQDVRGQWVSGVAPGASLVVQKLNLSPVPGLPNPPPNLRSAFQTPYEKNKVRIHNNSWGIAIRPPNAGLQLPYGPNDAQVIDRAALDWPDLLIVLAAGNDGLVTTATAQIGAHGAAKNALVVGASHSLRPVTKPIGAVLDKYDAVKGKVRDPAEIADFSSRGPTLEGRIKPDVVAPGVCLLSAKTNSKLAKHEEWEQNNGTPIDPKFPFVFSTGTSMAAPVVSGCAALVREALEKTMAKGFKPSSALVKALLINGADDLGKPTDAQGFGRVYMPNTLRSIRPSPHHWFLMDEFMTMVPSDAAHTTDVPALSPHATSSTLKITLVYIDGPGALIQNHLNMKVQHLSATGSVLQELNSEAAWGANPQHENNVHQLVMAGFGPKSAANKEKVHIVVQPKAINFECPWAVVWDFVEYPPPARI